LAAAFQWLIWRTLNGVPVISDEASYLLQAKLFAAFKWTAPAAPIREFFEQAHVLITPIVASKYPPGHALLLALGAMVGKPGLVPVLLSGVTAGLLFAITRRLANGPIAALAWLIWCFAPVPEGFRPSYFSEATTAATWVAGWWALLRWRDDGRTRWLVMLSLLVAWCAITRPLTAVAYAIPTGAVALTLIVQRRAWRQMTTAVAAGLVVVAILPLWNWRTLGDARRSPYAAYTEAYIPFEHLGFGDNGRRTPTDLPPDLYRQFAPYELVHARYTRATLVAEAGQRAYHVWYWFLGRSTWTAILSVFVLLGIAAGGVPGLIASGAAVALWLAYLPYAHAPSWTLYYYEVLAPLAFLAALGVGRAAALVVARRMPAIEGWSTPKARRVVVGVTVVCLPFALASAGACRANKSKIAAAQTAFAREVKRIPTPAIVFIRYSQNHVVHASYVANDPQLAKAPVWLVYDRGDDDARLRAVAPQRRAFLFDEATWRMVPLQ
jgi:hypothetical protein